MSTFGLLNILVKIQYLDAFHQLQKYYSQKEVNDNHVLFCQWQASGVTSFVTVLDAQLLAISPKLFEIYFHNSHIYVTVLD